MFSFFSGLLAKLSTTARYWVGGILLVLLIGGGFYLFNQVQSCGYHRAEDKYLTEAKQWKEVDRPKLIAAAEEKEKQVQALESQVALYKTAYDQGKKLDADAVKKIDEITKEAANEEAATNADTDCSIRAERTVAKLRSLKPPIIIDLKTYQRKLCSQ